MDKYIESACKLNIIGFPVTDRCNLSCPHCLGRMSTNMVNSPDMDQPTAEYLASKLSGQIKSINLSAGYGETYLNESISKILEAFRGCGLKTITYTNGSTAARKGILNSYTDMLLISVDEYHSVCAPAIFNQQCSLINDIHASGEQSLAGKIVLTCVLDSKSFNPDYIVNIRKLCEKHPFLSAEFHWKMEYVTTSIQHSCSNSIIDKYQKLFAELDNKKIAPPSFEHYRKNQCHDVFDSLYFDSCGNLRKCCIFPDTIYGLNIFKQSLQEIISSPQLEAAKKSWNAGKCYSFCKRCPIGYGVV